MLYKQAIKTFTSDINEEMKNRQVILDFIKNNPDILTRNNKIAHLTGSAMVFNHNFTKTLMIHHNIYQSWGWTGGHADGQEDLLKVAVKEAKEETGLERLTIFYRIRLFLWIFCQCLAITKMENTYLLTCIFSLCYALQANEEDQVFVKPDEEQRVVSWIVLDEIEKLC